MLSCSFGLRDVAPPVKRKQIWIRLIGGLEKGTQVSPKSAVLSGGVRLTKTLRKGGRKRGGNDDASVEDFIIDLGSINVEWVPQKLQRTY